LLRDSPHYEEMSIHFSWRNTPSYYCQAALKGSFIPVVSGDWMKANPRRGYFRDYWTIGIRPVPSEYKNVARRVLMTTGLPALRSWFTDLEDEQDLHTSKTLMVSVRLLDGEVRLRRSARAA